MDTRYSVNDTLLQLMHFFSITDSRERFPRSFDIAVGFQASRAHLCRLKHS